MDHRKNLPQHEPHRLSTPLTNFTEKSLRNQANIPEGLAVFALPQAHQRRLRTSNALERVNQELKRRTRVASCFPNEASLLRLVSALLCEISDEWITGKIYLNMNPIDPSLP